MKYRNHQDFEISEIGVGCYTLSGAYGAKDPNQFKKIVLKARDLGVNFFDTADSYGESAEQILGETLKPFRQEVYLATKVGIQDGIKPNLSPEYIHQACENSLSRLKTDYIDLYQIHFDDPHTPVEETLQILNELCTEGKIRKFGVGHLPLKRIKTYKKLGNPFSVLFELSAVARESTEKILPFCHQNNLAGIAFSVTGRGILTGKIREDVTFEPGDIRILDPLFQRERFQSALRICKTFQNIGLDYNKTSTQVAIAWVLAQPGITCALTGPSTIPHLEENIQGSGWPLPQTALEKMDHVFKKEKAWLLLKQGKVLEKLLIRDLNKDPIAAFTDLIYIIETAVLLNLVEESELLPAFIELFQLRDELERDIRPELERIHQILRDKIRINLRQ